MSDSDKIVIRRLKRRRTTLQEQYSENFEEWVAYWRANIHRFITEFLGLPLYDFQKILMWEMKNTTNYIYIASRGAAKSSIALDFACAMCILYPGLKVLVVCPVKSQSKQFVKKIYEYMRMSKNLELELDVEKIKVGVNECQVPFKNGSTIFTATYGENSLGIRTHVLIVDEFVRTEKEVITRVFDPMLSDSRKPMYLDLTPNERAEAYKSEALRKLYLSSIRRADEWSYKTFEDYIDWMTNGNTDYCATVVSYVLGVKNGFISKKKVEDTFKSNLENMNILQSEYNGIPERGTGNSYFTYKMMDRVRTNSKAFVCMSDEEYIQYKDCREKYPYYQEKLPNEIRLLCMDVAVIESSKNDNTAFFIIRLIPDSGRYTIIVPYADSMHGLNSIAQTKRMKQLFYEFECDYMILDTQGVKCLRQLYSNI